MENRETRKNKTWVVTGASSGFGLEITKYLISHGHNVVAFSRNPEAIINQIGNLKNLYAVNADLNAINDITDKLNIAVKKFTTIDIVLNNAGYGMLGPFEEISNEEIMAEFNVNVFYSFNVIKAVLPILRKQKYGHIFNTSSIAGYMGYPYCTVYSAVKFALDGFSEALNTELKPVNISVSSILPGAYRTNFMEKTSIKYADSKITDYQTYYQGFKADLDAGNQQQMGDPKLYAKFIYNLSKNKTIPVHIFAGSDAMENALAKLKVVEKEIKSYQAASDQTKFKDFKEFKDFKPAV